MALQEKKDNFDYKRWAERQKRASLLTPDHEKAIRALAEASLNASMRPEKVESYDLLAQLADWDELGAEYVAKRDEIIGVKSGLRSIDAMTMGFAPGEVTIIGARTSHGKTQFACNIAWRVALANQHVLFVSLEMTKPQLNARIQTLNKGPLDSLPLTVQKPERPELEQIEQIIELAVNDGAVLVIIDHLHYLAPRGDNQANVIGEVSRQIKSMALRYNIPILLPAQMNREGSKSEELSMYHLKDSGYIEQDADIILLLQRGDPEGNGELEANELLVKLAKNRTRGIRQKRATILSIGQDGMTLIEKPDMFPVKQMV